MSQALFDLYKEALRRGHVAAVQGNLDAALTAYQAAATIAPDRALPHASVGDVFKRLRRFDEAERAFDAALQRAPSDEAALRGRASTRLELGRPIDAARDLEALADVLERANRIPEACNAACAALEIADTRSRRQVVERLAEALTGIAGEPGAAAALARANPFLDPNRPKVTPELLVKRPPETLDWPASEPKAVDTPVEAAMQPEPEPESVLEDQPEPLPEPESLPELVAAANTPAEIEAEPIELEAAEIDLASEPEPVTAESESASESEPESGLAAELDASVDLEPAAVTDAVEPQAEPEPIAEPDAVEAQVQPRARFHVVAARAEAEALLIAGDHQRARPLLLRIAEAEREAGRLDAAIDACLILVTIDPADTAVQLELATIQAARGWTDLARDKIALLTRLADLDDDPDAQALLQGSSVVRDLATTGRQDRESAPHL